MHGCTEENHLEALGGNDYANITLGSLGQQTIDCLGPNRQVLNSDIILNSSDNIRKLGSNKCKFLFEGSSIDGQLALNQDITIQHVDALHNSTITFDIDSFLAIPKSLGCANQGLKVFFLK